MKKIFGVMSLIAILTVAFTSQASEADTVSSHVEFVLNDSSTVALDTATFEAPKEVGVFNFVAGELAGAKESVDSTNIVPQAIYKFGKDFSKTHLPIEVGIFEDVNDTNIVNKSDNTQRTLSVTSRSDAQKPVGWKS